MNTARTPADKIIHALAVFAYGLLFGLGAAVALALLISTHPPADFQGYTGANGPQGTQGATGARGARGAPGTTITHTLTITPGTYVPDQSILPGQHGYTPSNNVPGSCSPTFSAHLPICPTP